MKNTLDKWLSRNNQGIKPINKINRYFVYNKKTNTALWFEKKPLKKNINFEKKVTVKELNETIIVCGNIETNPDDLYNVELNQTIQHTPLLKSNLQKAIRRGNLEIALKTSKTLIKTNFNEFLRRLFIIVLEDTTAHHCLNELVWMCASYPLWKPSKDQINWLIGVVEVITLNPYWDIPCFDQTRFDLRKNSEELAKLDIFDMSMIYSIVLRASYGGMICDVNMIHYYANLWFNRLVGKNADTHIDLKLRSLEIVPIDVDTIKNIKKTEILNEAIDYHCFPEILRKITDKYDHINPEHIKKAIWHNNSDYNYRDNYDHNNTYDILWNLIEGDVRKKQKDILDKLQL